MARPEKPQYVAPADLKQSENRKKALQTALDQINMTYGKGAVMRLGDNVGMEISVIPTGCLSLDLSLGVGGLPRGRIVEIYGPEASGKTTLALHMIASAQRNGGEAAFIDAEHALDPVYAKALGVDTDNLLISQPDNGEQALEICEALVRSGALDIIIIDSVAALVPRAELDGHMGDAQVGLHARLMSQAMRKLAGSLAKTNTVAVFINQLREKVSTGYGGGYGNNETTTGGRALKFYASVRIDVRRTSYIETGGVKIGATTILKVVKNKTAPPFRNCTVDILYGEGISHTSELLDLGERLGLVQKSGSWFSAGDIRLGQGKDAARAYLKENPEFADDLEAKIRTEGHTLQMINKPRRGKVAPAGRGVRVLVEASDLDNEESGGNA
ncbi:MAG: recombinase RecA [Oscillospiraceae bacterium]|nr:recombinase RecA [Oscillospiraceae bacterium]